MDPGVWSKHEEDVIEDHDKLQAISFEGSRYFLFRIKGHSTKGMSCTDKNTMVFVVLEGEITVILHTTQFNAKKGDSFYIPPKVCFLSLLHPSFICLPISLFFSFFPLSLSPALSSLLFLFLSPSFSFCFFLSLSNILFICHGCGILVN